MIEIGLAPSEAVRQPVYAFRYSVIVEEPDIPPRDPSDYPDDPNNVPAGTRFKMKILDGVGLGEGPRLGRIQSVRLSLHCESVAGNDEFPYRNSMPCPQNSEKSMLRDIAEKKQRVRQRMDCIAKVLSNN